MKETGMTQIWAHLRVSVGARAGGTAEHPLSGGAGADVHAAGRDVVLQDVGHVVLQLAVHLDLHRRRVVAQLAALTCFCV